MLGQLDWFQILPFVAFNFDGKAVTEQQARSFVAAFDVKKQGYLDLEDYRRLLVNGNLKGKHAQQKQSLEGLVGFLQTYDFGRERSFEATADTSDNVDSGVKTLLNATFEAMDTEGTGRLDAQHIKPFVAFNFKGRQVSLEQVETFVRTFDSEKKGEPSHLHDETPFHFSPPVRGQDRLARPITKDYLSGAI